MELTKKMNDLTNRVFERLTVLRPVGLTKSRSVIWECLCSCGKIKNVPSYPLISGATKSCGCYSKDMFASRKPKNNLSKTTEYYIWSTMKQRCYNVNNHKYSDYGARGISVCDRWIGKSGFKNFLEDMGERPFLHTLDRIENDKDYSKENCRWATPKEQGANKRNNIWIEYNGERKIAAEWGRLYNINPRSLIKNINRNIPFKDVIEMLTERRNMYSALL